MQNIKGHNLRGEATAGPQHLAVRAPVIAGSRAPLAQVVIGDDVIAAVPVGIRLNGLFAESARR